MGTYVEKYALILHRLPKKDLAEGLMQLEMIPRMKNVNAVDAGMSFKG